MVPVDVTPEPVVAPVAVAPKPAPIADEDDGFADVVPTDLKDLVEENAPPLAPRSPFEQGTEVIPSGIADLISESESVSPISEEPFESLLPSDAKDLLDSGDAALSDIDDGEFEALK